MGYRAFYKVWIRSVLGILRLLAAAVCVPRDQEGLGGRREVLGAGRARLL